ncbi:MAG: O-antigen ligase family protein [Planctomycetota bacterium]
MTRSVVLQVLLGAIFIVVLTRASVIYEPMPGWDGNPIQSVSAIVGLGPAGYLLLDVVSIVLAGLVCLVAGRRLGLIPGVSLVASAAVVAHTLIFARGDAEPLPIAGAWASGAALLAAGSVIASRPALRRATLAITLGFLCVVLAKGVGQLLIEHPSVVAAFDLNPEAALAERGYLPGSPAALQFERRLRQPDITGWFGLSNVLAAYLAAGAVGCGAMCIASRRIARDWAWLVVAALGGACWLGVYLTGSKAGLAIAAAGTLAVAASTLLRARFGDTGWVSFLIRVAGVGLWVLPLAAIAARALLLPYEGELSLLFRWFYIDSAVDIARQALPFGTGADGFRAEYAVVKPPIAPETVTSSHNALTDWAAMLGFFGLPLIIVFIASAWRVAPRLGDVCPQVSLARPRRAAVLCMALILAVPVVASATLEADAALVELSLIRIAGLGLAVAVAAAVWRLRPGPGAATAIALVVLTHAQLDMLLFHPGSAPLAMFLVGLASPSGSARRFKRWAAAIPLVASIGVAILCMDTWRWESSLRRAFAAAQQIASVSSTGPGQLPVSRNEFDRVLAEQATVIRDELQAAAEAMPRDPRAPLARCDVELMISGPGQAAWEAAQAALRANSSVRTLGRAARVADAIAQTLPSSIDRDIWIERAKEHLVLAANSDPHGPHFPAIMAELQHREANSVAAQTWAARALQADDNYSLDPLAQLPEPRRRRLERYVRGDVSRP